MAWESFPGNSAGPMNGDGSRKLTIHSTEGNSIEGAVAAYRARNSWSTLTVDCRRRRVARHLSDTVAARSLQNDPGGADQTNKDGDVHIQIEVVGRAADPSSFGSPEDMAWFGREVIGPLCRRNSIPIATSVRFIAYRSHPPSSYGESNGVRLSPAAWDSYSGVLGHMHVPDNDHGDPGAFPIATVLAAARGDDFDMTPEERKDLIDDIATAVVGKINTALKTPRSVIRDKGRELAQLGAEDAIKALSPEEPAEPVPPAG